MDGHGLNKGRQNGHAYRCACGYKNLFGAENGLAIVHEDKIHR